MRYQVFGNTGLKVSELALGAMTFGEEWGWGSSRTEYLIEPLCALRAAVGHPYLQTLAGPVELVQEQPSLLVARTKDGIHITLHPPCEREVKYAVSLEANRLRPRS